MFNILKKKKEDINIEEKNKYIKKEIILEETIYKILNSMRENKKDENKELWEIITFLLYFFLSKR